MKFSPFSSIAGSIAPEIAHLIRCSVCRVISVEGVHRNTLQPNSAAVLYFSTSLRKPFGRVCRP